MSQFQRITRRDLRILILTPIPHIKIRLYAIKIHFLISEDVYNYDAPFFVFFEVLKK